MFYNSKKVDLRIKFLQYFLEYRGTQLLLAYSFIRTENIELAVWMIDDKEDPQRASLDSNNFD